MLAWLSVCLLAESARDSHVSLTKPTPHDHNLRRLVTAGDVSLGTSLGTALVHGTPGAALLGASLRAGHLWARPPPGVSFGSA